MRVNVTQRNDATCTRNIKCGGRAPEALTLLWCTARPLGRVVRLLLEAANLLDDVEGVVLDDVLHDIAVVRTRPRVETVLRACGLVCLQDWLSRVE